MSYIPLTHHKPKSSFKDHRRKRPLKTIRLQLLKISPICFYCQIRLSEKDATLDHLNPVSQGGSNVALNLVLACRPCNQNKAAKDWREFINGDQA